MPACAYALITRPEQSKHDGPDPPKQYHFPVWCSAHRSATSRLGVVDAEAGDGASGASSSTTRAAASAATMARPAAVASRAGRAATRDAAGAPAGPAEGVGVVPEETAAMGAAGLATTGVN